MPESRRFLLYSSRSAALTWPIMNGAGPAVLVVVVVAAVAGAFGFDAFLAKAPEVETARIARPTRTIFIMLDSLAIALEKHGTPPKAGMPGRAPCRLADLSPAISSKN